MFLRRQVNQHLPLLSVLFTSVLFLFVDVVCFKLHTRFPWLLSLFVGDRPHRCNSSPVLLAKPDSEPATLFPLQTLELLEAACYASRKPLKFTHPAPSTSYFTRVLVIVHRSCRQARLCILQMHLSRLNGNLFSRRTSRLDAFSAYHLTRGCGACPVGQPLN